MQLIVEVQGPVSTPAQVQPKQPSLVLLPSNMRIRLSDSSSSDAPPSVLVTSLTNYAANKAKQSISELIR